MLSTMLLFSSSVFSQSENPCPEVDDKGAIQLFEKGTDRKKYEKEERMKFLKQAIEMEENYVEALYSLVDEIIRLAKFQETSYKSAEKYLLKIVQLCPEYNPTVYFYLGSISYSNKNYEEAQKHFSKYIKMVEKIKETEEPVTDKKNKKIRKLYTDEDFELADKVLKRAKENADMFGHPVPFNPVCVNDVSTNFDEYLAIISPDNELMFYTRKSIKKIIGAMVGGGSKEVEIEQFSQSNRTGESFDKGVAMPHPFNAGDNFGGATITPDNKHLFITACKKNSKGYMNCDIFSSDFVIEKKVAKKKEDMWLNINDTNTQGRWTALKNLGENINTIDGWEAQPSISSDGKTLYFATFRAESKGLDIYKSERNAAGEWGVAERMGVEINTDKNEKTPFIHSDSQTLYFSSDGHNSIGGYDIYYTRATDEKENWQAPKNLGYPINTEEDEVGFFVSMDGKLGYFASNAIKGKCKGGYDIFAFDLYQEARPDQVLLIKGEVKDDKGEIVRAAKVEIKNAITKEIEEVPVDSFDGKFAAIVNIKKRGDLVLTVKKEGMTFTSKLISVDTTAPKKIQKVDMEVKPIEMGGTYKLNNINFAKTLAELTPESYHILDELIIFLASNPNIKIAIHGHTDDVSDDASNLKLSTDRANAVMQYLIEKNINKERLSYKGFGESKPLVPNTNEENRAKNRRTEFVVLEM